jgi:hypothetical protein
MAIAEQTNKQSVYEFGLADEDPTHFFTDCPDPPARLGDLFLKFFGCHCQATLWHASSRLQ